MKRFIELRLENVEVPMGVVPKKPTNADHIRSMSDEELAEMLWKTGRNYRAVCADPVVDHNEQCAEIVNWLQQPAEEDDNGKAD